MAHDALHLSFTWIVGRVMGGEGVPGRGGVPKAKRTKMEVREGRGARWVDVVGGGGGEAGGKAGDW